MNTELDKSGLISQTSTKKKIREYNIDTLDTDEYILDRDYECYCDDAELSNISDEILTFKPGVIAIPQVSGNRCIQLRFVKKDKYGSLTPNNFSIESIVLNTMHASYLDIKNFLLTIKPSNYSLKYDNIVYKSGTIAEDLLAKIEPEYYKSGNFNHIKANPLTIQIIKEST